MPDPPKAGDGHTLVSAAPDVPAELAADLSQLHALLARGDVEGARGFVSELQQRWPENDRIRHLAHVLAPPTVRHIPRSLDRSLRPEQIWLQKHAREYPGCWLAVFGDHLVAADPRLATVLDIVGKTPGAETALIHFQPGTDKCP